LLFGFGACAIIACDGAGAPDAGRSRDAAVEAAPVTSAVVDASSEPEDASADAALDIDALSAQGIGMIEEIASLIQTDEKDCDKMGSDLDAYYTKNGGLIDSMKDIYMKMPKAERKPIQTRYRPRFDAAWKKLQPGLKKCKEQPQLKTLLRKSGN